MHPPLSPNRCLFLPPPGLAAKPSPLPPLPPNHSAPLSLLIPPPSPPSRCLFPPSPPRRLSAYSHNPSRCKSRLSVSLRIAPCPICNFRPACLLLIPRRRPSRWCFPRAFSLVFPPRLLAPIPLAYHCVPSRTFSLASPTYLFVIAALSSPRLSRNRCSPSPGRGMRLTPNRLSREIANHPRPCLAAPRCFLALPFTHFPLLQPVHLARTGCSITARQNLLPHWLRF
ncbi:unnamed protein product [Closterium sp. NIES-53]